MDLPTVNAVDHAVHELVTRRRSPYGFAERPVAPDDLRALFEAARWAASSRNEQPWRYLVARREDADRFARILGCLTEGNRKWAALVPVLALGVIRTHFSHNDRPNRCAPHDLGAASAQLTLEATMRGLAVHQMGGILPDHAREEFRVPADFEVFTGLAIGYPDPDAPIPPELRARERKPRTRRPQAEFVFGDRWEKPARLGED